MKLSRNQVENLLKTYVERERERGKKEASCAFSPGDSSTYSPETRKMSALKKRLRKIPTTRQEMIEAVRKYIEKGQYHPGGMEVAKKTLYRTLVDFVIGKEEGSDRSE
ncbi:MAG: flagellar biosynthesis anti-sigma factor FlgM [Candidatus Caldatribacteriaceae bacterium]